MTGGRLRVGIPVTYQFSVRYLVHTGLLRSLAGAVDPVVLLGWNDPGLVARLESEGAEVRPLPPARYGPAYLRHRRVVEALHEHRLGSPSTAIDRRRRNALYRRPARARRQARWAAYRTAVAVPGAAERVLARERTLLEQDTNRDEAGRAVADARLDAMFSVTPYHRAEELVLRSAVAAGLPAVTSVISFDNPTTRGWISTPFDRYLVWNAHNRNELVRAYPDLTADRVAVTGAPQFDFYGDPRWCWDETTWRRRLGLDEGRPMVLFAGGPEGIVPHEPHLLAQLDGAVASGEIPGDPVILFRRHPMERPERWAPVVEGCRHVVADEPWAVRGGAPEHSAAAAPDIERLVSTLAHSAVHVSTSSTMTVDGAWFDRPQVGPAYDDRPGRPAHRLVRDLYRREHWLPIARSGGMVVAGDRDELVAAVARGLTHPAERAAERARLVSEVVTHTDGRATERVAAETAAALGAGPVPAGAAGEAVGR